MLGRRTPSRPPPEGGGGEEGTAEGSEYWIGPSPYQGEVRWGIVDLVFTPMPPIPPAVTPAKAGAQIQAPPRPRWYSGISGSARG